jgi:replicative DNA helicase
MSADGSLALARDANAETGAAQPPHNLDAEQGLLGAILYDNEVYSRIGDRLKGDHFYDPVHGRIFQACAQLIAKGKLADGVTLKEHFQRDGALQEIGGAAYLLVLLQNAARLTVHAQEYADIVYDLHVRRQLIRVGGEITELALYPPPETEAEDQISVAEQKLFNLAETGSATRGFSSFGEALTHSIQTAAIAYENKGEVSGIATGFLDLDKKMGGLHPSDLLIIAGRPSMGKTSFAANLAFNVAKARLESMGRAFEEGEKRPGGVVAFFSLEMSSEQLATRLLSDAASIESDKIRRGAIEKHQYEQLLDASRMLQSLPMYIDETGGISISQLMARARRLQRSSGLDLIVIDYLQLITASERRGEGNRVLEISEITQNLKALAKDLKVPVIALSQLSRAVESRPDKRPMLSDLRESGSIEQDADIVMFVYREEYYKSREEPRPGTDDHIKWQREMDEVRNRAEIIIGKQRHGPIGTVELQFDSRFTRFSNLAHEHQRALGHDH